ncbi:MAG: hypothetical protein ACOC4L_05280 [Halanaerobium sp.]
MKINNNNREKYIKRVLKLIIRKYAYRWLCIPPSCYSFNLEEILNRYGKHEMKILREYLVQFSWIRDNLQIVYNKVKHYEDIKELLNYLSPGSYNNSEMALLCIIRGASDYEIYPCDRPGRYYISFKGEEPLANEEIPAALKKYFRTYTFLLLVTKKEAVDLDNLYEMVLEGEIDYSFGSDKQVFFYLRQHKGKTIEELLEIAGGDKFKKPRQIFKRLIKTDYNRFFHIYEDYYGSKKWDQETKLNVELKVYDRVRRQDKENKKFKKLARGILEKLESSDMDERKKNNVERIIKRDLEEK